MRVPITPVTTLQRQLRDELRRRNPAGRVIIAVDGADVAGRTAFADGLAAVLGEDGTAVFRASIADFQRPRAERDRLRRTLPERGDLDSYDDSTFRRVLVDPFRQGWQTAETLGFQLAAFDAQRDAPVESRWVTAPDDAVLVVDGIFLHRPELRELWNWSIRLEAPAEHEPHPREQRPREVPDAVVDNTDPLHPVRLAAAAR